MVTHEDTVEHVRRQLFDNGTNDLSIKCPTLKYVSADAMMDVILFMLRFVSLPPLVFGIPGNSMIILIANRQHNKQLSPSIYMTAMAVSDSLLILLSAVFQPLYYGTDLIVHKRGLLSRVEITFVITLAIQSGYYLSAMSVDRLIAIRFPMAAPNLCTTGRARQVVIYGTIIITVVNVYLPFALINIKDNITGLENLIFSIPNDPTGSLLATGFQLLCGTFLPFTIIISSNIIIIVTIKVAAKRRVELQGQKKDDLKNRTKSQHLTRMLIFVSLAYVITSTPYRMSAVLLLVPQVTELFDLTEPCNFILYNLLTVIFYGFWIWNFAANFYMYIIGGGQKYRKDISELWAALVEKCSMTKQVH